MPADQPAKRQFLCVYEYGMGGLWCYIAARSESEIAARYPELKIVDKVPSWLTEEHSAKLNRYDIDEAPWGWLAVSGNERPRPGRAV